MVEYTQNDTMQRGMFELRIYTGANPPAIHHYVNGLVPLSEMARLASSQVGFNFTRAECWWNGHRQWELLID